MKILLKKSLAVRLLCVLLVVMLNGCLGGQAAFRQGQHALRQDNYDQAVMDFLQAVDDNPDSRQYQLMLVDARNKAAVHHTRNGDELFAARRYHDALQEYQLAVELDGSLFVARESMAKTQRYLQAETFIEQAAALVQVNRPVQAQAAIDQALALVPDYPPALAGRQALMQNKTSIIDGVALDVTSDEPITLNFKRTKLSDVFNILTKLTGIHFILDEDVRGTTTTLYLEQATFSQSLELLLQMNKLEKKILNSKTIVLFPKTRDKQKQFEDQIIQTFYLSHLDAKQAVNLLRTMLDVRKVYVQEELNAIVLRDELDVVRLAQKLIEANDRGNSEVVFDLELIEVSHDDTRELGLKLSTYSMGAGLSDKGSGVLVNSGLSAGDTTSGLISSFRDLEPFYAIPTATFQFAKSLGNTEILASPKIRVRNKQKAKVHVGSREPIISATTSDSVVSESVSYIDVGVKLDVEPAIQLDNTVVTKVGLEVSNVSNSQTTSSGTVAYTISSTSADTTLTLKDGEQTVIGGLIREDNKATKTKIPLLGEIPLLGNLFNHDDREKSKREILLSITPHIVKLINVPQGDVASLWSGSEDDLKFGRNFGTFVEEYRNGQQIVSVKSSTSSSNQNFGDENNDDPVIVAESFEAVKDGETGFAVTQNSLSETDVTEVKVMEPRLIMTGTVSATVGTSFDVAVAVEGMPELVNAPLLLSYDPRIVTLIRVDEGEFLKRSSDTLFTYTDLKGQGKIIISLKQKPGGTPVSGAGELVHLMFKALKPGNSRIATQRANLKNALGEAIALDLVDCRVEIRAGQ